MKLYLDLLGDKDCFTDAYPPKIEGNLVGNYCKFIDKQSGIDGSLIGANASAEEQEEQLEDTAEKMLSCEDFKIVQQERWPVKAMKKYWLKYFSSTLKKCQDSDEKECVGKLKAEGKAGIEEWLKKYENEECDLFAHEDIDFESANVPLFVGEWLPSGTEVYLYTINCCLRDCKL